MKSGNYEAKILSLNKHAIVIEDLKLWLEAIPNAKNNINTSEADFEINTDASETGDGEPHRWLQPYLGVLVQK